MILEVEGKVFHCYWTVLLISIFISDHCFQSFSKVAKGCPYKMILWVNQGLPNTFLDGNIIWKCLQPCDLAIKMMKHGEWLRFILPRTHVEWSKIEWHGFTHHGILGYIHKWTYGQFIHLIKSWDGTTAWTHFLLLCYCWVSFRRIIILL